MSATGITAAARSGARGIAALACLMACTVTAARGQYPTDPPPPTALRPLEFPALHEERLDNALDLIVVENDRLPIVSMSMILPAGSRFDPPGLEGLAAVTAELLTKGTETRSAEEIALTIESVGGSLTATADDDFLVVTATVLTEHTELAFELLGEVLTRATFPEEELELARTRFLSALQAEKSDPNEVARRFFRRVVYGEHPYGRLDSESSLSAIARSDIEAYRNARLLPGGSVLVIAGDLSPERARRLTDQHLGAWRGTADEIDHAGPPAAQSTKITLVHRPGSAQSDIRVGNLALRPRDPAYYPALIANRVLGGGTDARLFLILREEKGWTYGAYSNLGRRKDIGYFGAVAQVRTEVTDSALVELLAQLRRIRSEAVPDSELANAKAYLIGSFPLGIQTPQQVADQIATVRVLGLEDDYLQTYRERLAAVDAAQALEGARAIIKPDSAVIVVVGDGEALYDKLAAIAPVSIVDVDANPLTPDDLAPKAVVLAFDRAHIVARRDSFQISLGGNPIGRQVAELIATDDSVVYREWTAIEVAGMSQELTLRLDPVSLYPLSAEGTGQVGGQPTETSFVYEGGRVTGRAQTPQGTAEADTTLLEGTLDVNALPPLLPALPLSEGYSATINAFVPSEGAARPMTIRVSGVQEVTVPAGTFTTFRVDVTGGPQPAAFYVSTDAPRRIVKIEFVGQPVAFELIQGS